MVFFSRRIEILILGFLSLLFAAWFLQMAWLSPGVEGGMDSYQHYQIARYSWKYPHLFLHQWGKPLYNILASPFAQFGMIGSVVFNVLMLLGTAWVTYFTARGLGWRHAWLGFAIVLCSPVFFDQIISSLTEPLCAFLLSVFFFFMLKDKHYAAAIIAGLLPFARSEGFIIMAVAGCYFLFISRNWKAFALLLAGSVIFNFLGWIIEEKPLWIITENPYVKVEVEKINICGSGSLLHYLKAGPITFGWVGGGLIFLGLLSVLVSGIRNIKSVFRPNQIATLFWVVAGSFVLYFSVHSVIWYLGKMGSCGYIRVMTVIVPAGALLATYFLESMEVSFPKFFQNKTGSRFRYFVCTILLLLLVREPFKLYAAKYPIEISDEQKLYVEVADWLKEQPYQDRVFYFLYPYLNVIADIDPYDFEKCRELWGFDFRYAPKGCIVIWDGHFGPNECRLPLEKLKEHPDFRMIRSFYPDKPFKTINNYDYEIHIFERINKPKN